MELIKHLIDQLARDEDGQDMVEYALIMGLISIIAVVAVTATGVSVRTIWTNVQTAVAAAA
jgi:pilus assembly protein Flp/PilA